jgi:UDP-GlcNAc:undecaprenyl-phosphate GlcNAc-1-phosphate transferase
MGFSQRRAVLYLYGWTVTMAGLGVALRFVPYSDRGDWDLEWSLVIGAFFAAALAASVYLVVVLEIVKLRRVRAWQLRDADPATSEHEIDAERARDGGVQGARPEVLTDRQQRGTMPRWRTCST